MQNEFKFLILCYVFMHKFVSRCIHSYLLSDGNLDKACMSIETNQPFFLFLSWYRNEKTVFLFLLRSFIVVIVVSTLFVSCQYGKEYEYEAPVKLLDKLLHEMPKSQDEQLVVISQVCNLASFLWLCSSDVMTQLCTYLY